MRRVLALVAGLAIAAGSAGAHAQAQQNYKWRMTTLAPETSIYFTLFAKPFAERVKQMTNGQVEITPFGAGVIAPAFKGYEAVQDGLCELVNSWSGYLVNKDPANALLAGHPGGMGPEAYLTWVYEGGGLKLWQDFRRETMGLHTLVVGAGPSEIHLNSIKPIRTLEDLKGTKVRTAGAFAEILQRFGASPVTVPGTEIYTMLERKGVDAVEWSTPAENAKMGFQKVAKYVIMPGVHAPSFAFDMAMKKELWDGLPQNVKTTLENAARITTHEAYFKWLAEDLKAMEDLRKSGNEIVFVDQGYIDGMKKAGRDWAFEKAKDNAWMKRLADSYYGFMDKYEQNAVLVTNQKSN